MYRANRAPTLIRKVMAKTDRVEGVFAVHKPPDITSYDVIRDLQKHFQPSEFFKPWIKMEHERKSASSPKWERKLKDKSVPVKLGHGGTLDPIATGVLITGVGSGTKQLAQFLECKKTYEAVVTFGVATDSFDRVGKVVSRAPYGHVTRTAVEKALEQFRGSIMQKPSIFSALKVNGKKLYEYAREGKEPPVEILKRPVEVENLELLEWYEGGTHEYKWPEEEADDNAKALAWKMRDEKHKQGLTEPQKRKSPPRQDEPEPTAAQQDSTEPVVKRQKTKSDEETTQADHTPTDHSTAAHPEETSPSSPQTASPKPPAVKLTMTVSSGFYVRSLAHDLGLALGSNAIMSSLARTRQGDFDVSPENIIEYKDLEAGEEVWGPKLRGLLDKWANRNVEKGDGGEEAHNGSEGARNQE